MSKVFTGTLAGPHGYKEGAFVTQDEHELEVGDLKTTLHAARRRSEEVGTELAALRTDAARYRWLRGRLLARRAAGRGNLPLDISVHLTREFMYAGTQYMTPEQHEMEAKVLDSAIDTCLMENER